MSALESGWKDVRDEDIAKVAAQLAGGGLNVVSGGVLARFERGFARLMGSNSAVAFNCGTSSLYAALHAVGVRHGDDVLMADYGFHGMAAAVLALGARVVVCDVEPSGLTLDPAQIARRRTPRCKAVLVHHPWGVPADLNAIRAATDLPLVSDASHAHGALLAGDPLSRFADITCYSLGFGKLITGGELGCATTDDALLADRMMVLGHVNRVPADLKVLDWTGNAVGLKLRPHGVALTLASAQLGRFPEKQRLSQATAAAIEAAALEAGFQLQVSPCPATRSYWRILLRPSRGLTLNGSVEALETALGDAGFPVEANAYWPTLQDQRIFAWPGHEDMVLRSACPVAAAEARRSIMLAAPVDLDPGALSGLPEMFAQALTSIGR